MDRTEAIAARVEAYAAWCDATNDQKAAAAAACWALCLGQYMRGQLDGHGLDSYAHAIRICTRANPPQ